MLLVGLAASKTKSLLYLFCRDWERALALALLARQAEKSPQEGSDFCLMIRLSKGKDKISGLL